MVDVFRAKRAVMGVTKQAIEVGAKVSMDARGYY